MFKNYITNLLQTTTLSENIKQRLFLINKAVSIINGEVIFYPFDLNKYNNMGAKIDFSTRNLDDPLPNPQTEIIVNGIRLDTFIDENKTKGELSIQRT